MWGNASLIFVSKVIMIVFGYRSFEHYLKGNAWRTSLIDTTFFGIGIWMQRIIIADKSNPALVSALAGIFVGTFVATKLRKTDDRH
jgi:putative effector of murein hydrolase